jgi:hypothetical protein
MAFNPFRAFRKHQKTFFAIMVIVCMFVFILQFGAGDVFTRALSWFGAGRGKGTLVATLNGNKVYEGDLGPLYRERELANFFVVVAAQQSEPPPPQDRNAQPTLSQALAQEIVLRAQFLRQGAFGEFRTNEELLDFMLWRAKADKLGITLTESDVRKLINRIAGKDIFGNKPFTSSELVTRIIHSSDSTRRSRGLSADDLLRAVTDEFRVVLAQEALLGHGPGVFGGNPRLLDQRPRLPAGGPESALPAVTLGEFLKYYREQRTTLNVWMLPLKVDDFLAEAKKKPLPSDKELEKLFERYKGDVPTPTRARPAFKEPERVKVEWVSADAELPYFKEQARLRVELPADFTKLGPRGAVNASIAAEAGLLANACAAPGASAPWAALATAPLFFDRTLPRYSEFVTKQREMTFRTFLGELNIHDRSLTHPSQLGWIMASFTAGAGGNTGSLSVLSVALGSAAGASELDERYRLRNVELALFGELAVPPLAGAVVPPLGPLAYQSPVSDYWTLRERLLQELRTDELTNSTTGVIGVELTALSKDIAKSKSNPEETRKKIDEATKKFGLRHGSMPTALDRFQLEKDEGLKTLREEYLKNHPGSKPEGFATFLIDPNAPYQPKDLRLAGETYLVWQTEFIKAREPKSLAEARQKVEDAWYREEARILSRKQAEEWSAQARQWQSNLSVGEVEKRLREESKQEGFTLDKVARLVKALQDPMGKTYSPYAPPPSLIEYPRPSMVDQLVKQLKDKGDAMVISDLPERVYYVAVLESRDDQEGLTGFIEVLNNTPDKDTLWSDHFLPARRRDFEKMVIKQLRLEAGANLNDDGDYILPEGIRERGVDSREGD